MWGAQLAGGTSCRALYNEVLSDDYGDPGYGAVHLHVVDAYALQHPEEHGPVIGVGSRNPAWLVNVMEGDRKRQLPELRPPANRGNMRIVDVVEAEAAGDHQRLAREWAYSVWSAWSDYHNEVATWIERQAVEYR
jgi:hypothetical protein